MIEYRVYKKSELVQNPKNPQVDKTFEDMINTKFYCHASNYVYDVVVLIVDTTDFYIRSNSTIFEADGVLDVRFYPKRQCILTNIITCIKKNN